MVGKIANIGYAIGHLPADGVVILGRLAATASGNLFDNGLKSLDRLGGLGVKFYLLCKIEAVEIFYPLYDDGVTVGLPHKAVYLGMSTLAVNNNLFPLGSLCS